MARILFMVCGVGLGHASRSSIILKKLVKKHKVAVTSYSEGFDFLKREFRETERLEWFKIFFSGNKMNKPLTFATNLFILPAIALNNFLKVKKIVKEFRPDVIVSDFDINGVYAAKMFGLPIILISNMHTIDLIKIPLNFLEKIEFKLVDEQILRAYDLGTNHIMVTSIVKLNFREKKFYSFYPLVNEELLNQKTSCGNYFLVYMSKENLKQFLPTLQGLDEYKFIIYGLDEKKTKGNIQFKKFSKKSWLADMANCNALFCHGGLLTLSEAVVLKKPCYVFASKNWFERFHNGTLVQRLGFGIIEENPSKESVKEFIKNREIYRNKLIKKNIQPGNEKFMKKLNELIETLTRKQT